MVDQLDCLGSQPRKCNASGLFEKLGAACAEPTPMCSAGTCRCLTAVCANICVDTMSDPHNCGGCGNDCNVGSCAQGRCAPQVLASKRTYARGIVVDAENLYWIEVGLVYKMPKTGGTPIQLASLNSLTGLGLAGSDLYMATSSAGGVTAQILKLPTQGGQPTILYAGQFKPNKLVVHQPFIYWTAEDLNYLMRTPMTPGGTTDSLGPAGGGAGIATDATSVYWIDFYPGSTSRTRSPVQRRPRRLPRACSPRSTWR